MPHINSRGEERTEVARKSALYSALASLESAGALRRIRRPRIGYSAAYALTIAEPPAPTWVEQTVDALLSESERIYQH